MILASEASLIPIFTPRLPATELFSRSDGRNLDDARLWLERHNTTMIAMLALFSVDQTRDRHHFDHQTIAHVAHAHTMEL
jgi:hypothetical protein